MGALESEKDRKRNESGTSTTSSDSVSKYIPTPPDGGWGWVVVAASFVNHVIVDGVAFTFGIFYMEFMRHFNSSKSQTALVGSLLAGFYLMAGPVASALVNKFGCRVVCIAGSLISSLAFVLCTFSTSIQGMMLTYGCLGGFGFGLIYLPSIVTVSYYFEKRRALATGIAVCGAGVGCFIFAPAGRLLMERLDWKSSMYVVAGITLTSSICGMLMRPLEPKKRVRSKNIFDRLQEKFCKTDSNQNEVDLGEDVETSDVLEKIQEAKLARVQALNDDESDIVSLPHSRVSSLRNEEFHYNKSRNTSIVSGNQEGIVPKIIVEDEQENADEQTKMIKKNEENKLKEKGILKSPSGNKLEQAQLLANSEDIDGQQGGLRPDEVKVKSMSVWGLNPHRIPPGVDKADYARPLYRRDIFYSGSILHIQEFRSQPNVMQYVQSITAIPQEAEESTSKGGRCWKRMPIPKAAKDILRQMLDLNLLRDPVFLIACLGEIFGFVGLFVPFVFVAERAIQHGVSDQNAAFLLSVIGITNTIGRVLAGVFADFSWCNSLLLHNIMMILGGIACILNMFATTFATMCVFSAFFGLCVATYISLTSIILCDLMGLERLTSAFGLLTLVRGLSSIAGPPIAGYVFDLTQSYDNSFHVGGAMFIAAGSIYCLLHLPYFSINSRIAKHSKSQTTNVEEIKVILDDLENDNNDTKNIQNGDVQHTEKLFEVDLGDGSSVKRQSTSSIA